MGDQQYHYTQPVAQPAPNQQYNYNAPVAQPYEQAPQQYTYDANPAVANPSASMYPPIKPTNEETPIAPSGERFDYAGSKWRDPIFAVLFIVHLLGMGVTAAMYGNEVIDAVKNSSNDNPDGEWTVDEDLATVLLCLMCSAVTGLLFGMIWLKVIKTYADTIIKISLLLSSLFMLVAGVFALIQGSMIGGIVCLVLVALNALYYWLVRDRIPFAQAIITAASNSIEDNKTTLFVTYAMALLNIVWSVFWCFTAFAVFLHFQNTAQSSDPNNNNNDPQVTPINGVLYFFLLISFYWTGQVLKNICHVTTAGSVASWWLLPQMSAPVCPAFKRAMTTSFGSICFGSLIVAVLSAMREMCRTAKNSLSRSDNGGAACVACLFECMIQCIERLMKYFNLYAFTQVAIYGKSFVQAAKDTWALFTARGWTMLINDDLTGMVISMGALAGGVVSALAGAGLSFVFIDAEAEELHAYMVIAGIVGFLIGFIMVTLIMSALSSAVATTFVLWAEAPTELQRNRPEFYNKLQDTARARHPNRDW